MIDVATDFSRTPGPRYINEGEFSAQEFRANFLAPKLSEAIEYQQSLYVVMDGTFGYGASFIEEAFGGLVRDGFSVEDIKTYLHPVCTEEPSIVDEVWECIEDAGICDAK